jgi:hypothetical protein
MSKNIPIKSAREIAKDFDKDQVIIVAWSKQTGTTFVTTYGRTAEDCDQAAQGGNIVKKALGWPESLCNAEPSRIKRLKKENQELKERIKLLEQNHV